jgi:hypothetical protein
VVAGAAVDGGKVVDDTVLDPQLIVWLAKIGSNTASEPHDSSLRNENRLIAVFLAGHSVGNHPHRYKRGFAGDVILDCSFEENLEVRGRRPLVWRQRDQGFVEFGQPLRAR